MIVDEGHPISYQLLQAGTAIVSADGVELGTVERVIENVKEHIFDGIVMRADGGRLVWVDAPEVGRVAERRVTLTIDAAAAAQLSEYAPGAPEYRARPGGRMSRFFGGGWKRN